ncbi:hypothetical protein [Aurantimonas coralicida]|uniref:hypothetical protein n=1 Tax=Aurantimonas coralicida TaxID=182270 RepID=UPI001D1859D9|nr:hypothetical protein [Aurantimonas coralicida]MCC4300319.1 hypothetical protein [Aurantimonas coralicida]
MTDEAAFERALAQNPDHLPARVFHALSLSQEGRRDEAATAWSMAADERQAMIEGMVSQLASRLETNPDDVKGWKRLIRSYRVLGDAAAGAAYRTARRTFAADSAAGREIAAFGDELGLTAEGETQTQ